MKEIEDNFLKSKVNAGRGTKGEAIAEFPRFIY